MNQGRINILLVDDDEDDFLLTKDHLSDIEGKNFEVTWANSFEKGKEEIKKNQFDILIFDYLLGAKTGIDLITEAHQAGNEAPVILLTGKGDRQTDIRAMQMGASDYLVKSEMDSEKLDRAIRYAIDRSNNSKALKASEEKFRNIFERSRDMIYVTNQQGDFLDFNESATHIFGYTKEEFQKLNAEELYENITDRNAFVKAINHTGIISNYEVTLKHKSGERRFCLVSGSIQKGLDGAINYQGIIHDITRRRKAEKDLIIAEKLAVTGRVVRTLAHEIRNPLTNVNLAVEQLESESEDEELKFYFDIIKRNSKRINDLITELLQSSKPADVKPTRKSMNAVLDATLLLAIDRIELKSIRVIKDYSKDICDVMVDESKIQIALLNIIINAVEAMPQQGGVLKLITKAVDGRCVVIIEDNGSGIAPENIGRLFEPYFTGKTSGVGLGLATTHNILQSHDATVEVESELNDGTRFTLSFKM